MATESLEDPQLELDRAREARREQLHNPAQPRIAERHGKDASITTELATGDARDAIIAIAKRIGADLIVMGTHGRRGLSRALLGSVAETVVRSSPCAVLTLRKS